MIVGPASGGKTEALAIVDEVVVDRADDFTAPALLSMYKGANGKGPAVPCGILVRAYRPGIILVSDFSTVLSDSQRGRRDALFSALRRVFDGRYQRDLGNEDKALIWQGRITFIAACTSSIDNFASHSDSLGPRWVYLRMIPRDSVTRRLVTSRATRADATQMEQKRKDAQKLTAELIETASLDAPSLVLPDALMDRVEEAALVVCFGRVNVPRDSFGSREINGIPEMEEPPRVAKQLVMLLRCLLVLGLSDDEAIGIVSRVAIDSMPAIRALALGAVVRAEGPITTAVISRDARVDWKVVNRALEDFEALGLIHHPEIIPGWDDVDTGAAKPNPWVLEHEDADLIRNVFRRRDEPVLTELAG
jgi:hypothetical protein